MCVSCLQHSRSSQGRTRAQCWYSQKSNRSGKSLPGRTAGQTRCRYAATRKKNDV